MTEKTREELCGSCGVRQDREREIIELRSQVRRLKAAWQPIESAPKDGTLIFGWHKEWELPCCVLWQRFYPIGSEAWCFPDDGLCDVPPTYWLPVPLLPC